MKKLIASLLLFFSLAAQAEHVVSPDARVNLDTKKVVHIIGPVNERMAFDVLMEIALTYKIPGDRLVIIDSGGGRVDSGTVILNYLLQEKVYGNRIVCAVKGMAVSMAFNILSFCDVKIAMPDAMMMAHHAFVRGVNPMINWTPDKLRELADELEKNDAPFSEKNAQQLRLTKRQYDKYAAEEHFWSIKELIKCRYLDGVITSVN